MEGGLNTNLPTSGCTTKPRWWAEISVAVIHLCQEECFILSQESSAGQIHEFVSCS
jgi:hypothetical protein